MTETYQAIQVTDRVYWVGAVDWELRDFHGYLTSRGTTYNAYLVMADKVTLIDTVKAPFVDQLLARIASVIDPRDIDLVVSNHSEMDHSGSLPKVVAAVEPEKVYASQMGQKALAQHFHAGPEVTAVKDGESLSLGNMSLTFIETRMVHWPDSMMSYLAEEELLDQGGPLLLPLPLQDHPAGDHDVPPPLVELDDLEVVGLTQEILDVRDSPEGDLGSREEGVHAHEVHRDPPLDLANQGPLDWDVGLVGLLDLLPHAQEIGLLLRAYDHAVFVLDLRTGRPPGDEQ